MIVSNGLGGLVRTEWPVRTSTSRMVCRVFNAWNGLYDMALHVPNGLYCLMPTEWLARSWSFEWLVWSQTFQMALAVPDTPKVLYVPKWLLVGSHNTSQYWFVRSRRDGILRLVAFSSFSLFLFFCDCHTDVPIPDAGQAFHTTL